MAEEWSDAELADAVKAYREMQQRESEQRPYNKREMYRKLAEAHGRSEKAFEYRMQNISAVLNDLGQPWLSGLKPAANVGANVTARIEALLNRVRLRKAVPQAAYKVKLPAMRDWLIEVSRAGAKVTYTDVMEAFDIDRFSLRHAMDVLGHGADNLGEPILTAVIVAKGSQRCSIGLESEFGVTDDEAERQRLYAYWQAAQPRPGHDGPDASLEVRAARFASVAVRPAQAAFRRRVFIAYGGRCAVTGCDVGRALDAAHLQGRSWQLGHNAASDGVLLRKDLHALYDSAQLHLVDGQVVCSLPYYNEFHGKQHAQCSS